MAKKNDISKELKELTDDIADNAYEFLFDSAFEDEAACAARQIRRIYESFVEVGFTEKQAFEMAKIVLNNVTA